MGDEPSSTVIVDVADLEMRPDDFAAYDLVGPTTLRPG
jgi:hypothetical protein